MRSCRHLPSRSPNYPPSARRSRQRSPRQNAETRRSSPPATTASSNEGRTARTSSKRTPPSTASTPAHPEATPATRAHHPRASAQPAIRASVRLQLLAVRLLADAAKATTTVGPTSAPPILVVGSTGDPLTPYEGAQSMAKSIPSSVLLTRTGEGHGSYLLPPANPCINDAISSYLLNDSPPPPGTTC